MDWKKLQNGSDIRGVALEGVPGENPNITPEVTSIIAKAFIKWLVKRTKADLVSIAIGMDSRLSGPMLKQAFIDGAVETGITIYDCGLASTPAMFMTTVDKKLAVTGGVMITASHLPFNRNGIKFFTKDGGLEKADIAEILDIANRGELPVDRAGGLCVLYDFMARYKAHLVEYIRSEVKADSFRRPLDGLRIIVDAGNGTGGFFVDVLEELGANTTGSQFTEPDGHFPNHIPNPEDRKAMASVCQAVVKNNADLGIIFDTDVDRSAIVLRKGAPINRNSLIALIAAIILKEHPGSTIVTDSVTSDGLAEFIIQHGGKHHRFKRGYKNVIDEGIRLNKSGEECWLAIETSGHCALRENFFLDDGAFLVAKLIVQAARMRKDGKELQDLISSLRQPVESVEVRFKVNADDVAEYGQAVLDRVSTVAPTIDGWKVVCPNYEGVRVSCTNEDEQGWFLLRKSLHDPVLPLNIESDFNGGVEVIRQKLLEVLKPFDKLTIM
ncbi:MAG: phosphomannomutase/phosphoglucomutase [Prevotella sp.]